MSTSETLQTILHTVITETILQDGDATKRAESAAKAFKAGLTAFDSPTQVSESPPSVTLAKTPNK